MKITLTNGKDFTETGHEDVLYLEIVMDGTRFTIERANSPFPNPHEGKLVIRTAQLASRLVLHPVAGNSVIVEGIKD